MRDMWKELLFALNPWGGDSKPVKKEGGEDSQEGSQALLHEATGEGGGNENPYGEVATAPPLEGSGRTGASKQNGASVAGAEPDDGGYAVFNENENGHASRLANNLESRL